MDIDVSNAIKALEARLESVYYALNLDDHCGDLFETQEVVARAVLYGTDGSADLPMFSLSEDHPLPSEAQLRIDAIRTIAVEWSRDLRRHYRIEYGAPWPAAVEYYKQP